MREFVVKNCKDSGPFRLLARGSSAPEAAPARQEPEEPRGREETAPQALSPAPSPGEPVAPDPAPTPPTVRVNEKPQASPEPSPRRRGDRFFVVSYDGEYVGFFEAEEELGPQEAFMYVAHDIASRQPFDPDKLSLYKPVLIKSARPRKGSSFVRGKLSAFGGALEKGEADSVEPPAAVVEEDSVHESTEDVPETPIVCLEKPQLETVGETS